ncbi:MAG: helicase associated domain-containing protein [Bacteroidales bacterium]|nr:helicase associated domain-containing protein [Candidatus Colimorpha onthohippi]
MLTNNEDCFDKSIAEAMMQTCLFADVAQEDDCLGREKKWMANFEALKAYIEEHHHLPAKSSGRNAKYLLNWVKYQRKRMKSGLMSEAQQRLLMALLDSRSNEHTGGRKKKVDR